MANEYGEATAKKCAAGDDVTVTVADVTAAVLSARAEFYAFPTPAGKIGEGALAAADDDLTYDFPDADDKVRFVEIYIQIDGEVGERKEEPPLVTEC